MTLGCHLFPSWVFRIQNLDLISNRWTGGNLMQNLNSSIPIQETLRLAWCPTFRVGETCMAQEATPMLAGRLGHRDAL